jgi:hypothetical protein
MMRRRDSSRCSAGRRQRGRSRRGRRARGCGASENLASPIAAFQIRPDIVRDRAVRAWPGDDGGRATLAARLNSCSQPSAELFVLLLDTSQSLHTAFFNDQISL